jgi:hypothetical protein
MSRTHDELVRYGKASECAGSSCSVQTSSRQNGLKMHVIGIGSSFVIYLCTRTLYNLYSVLSSTTICKRPRNDAVSVLALRPSRLHHRLSFPSAPSLFELLGLLGQKRSDDVRSLLTLADKTLHSDFEVPFNTRRKLDDAGGRTAGVIAAALSSGPSNHIGDTSNFPSLSSARSNTIP